MDFFKKPLYREAYKNMLYPVPSPNLWLKNPTQNIHSHVFKSKKGSQQTLRRKGKDEFVIPKVTSRMATITCSNYKEQGHRYPNFGITLTPSFR